MQMNVPEILNWFLQYFYIAKYIRDPIYDFQNFLAS